MPRGGRPPKRNNDLRYARVVSTESLTLFLGPGFWADGWDWKAPARVLQNINAVGEILPPAEAPDLLQRRGAEYGG